VPTHTPGDALRDRLRAGGNRPAIEPGLEIQCQRFGRRVSQVGNLLQAFQTNRLKVGIDGSIETARRIRLLLQDAMEDIQLRFTNKWCPARQALIQNGAK